MQTWRDFKRIMKKMWPMGVIVGAIHMLIGVPFWVSMLSGLIEVGMWSAAFAFFMNAVEALHSGREQDAMDQLADAVYQPDAQSIVRDAFAAAA